MMTYHIVRATGALAVISATAVAVCYLTKSTEDKDTAMNHSAAGIQASAAPADPKTIAGLWKTHQTSLAEYQNPGGNRGEIWKQFSQTLKSIHPQAAAVQSEAEAKAALAAASAWLDARGNDARSAYNASIDSIYREVLAEIAMRRADLEALQQLSANPLTERLKNLVILGRDRRTAQGIDLIWIDDPSGHRKGGGFWASKREISTSIWQSVVGEAPKQWSPPRKQSAADFEAQARQDVLGTLTPQQKLTYNGLSPTEQATLIRSAVNTRAQQLLQANSNAAQGDYSKFKADFVNLSSKSDTLPFFEKIQGSANAHPAWVYRLPTQAEWALLKGKVEGIGSPDLSEWLADSDQPVDRNWKSDSAGNPPENGTVGFRAVLAEP